MTIRHLDRRTSRGTATWGQMEGDEEKDVEDGG